jgi:hypothetical protein
MKGMQWMDDPMTQAGMNVANQVLQAKLNSLPVDISGFPMSLFQYKGIKIYFDVELSYVLQKLQMISFPFIPEKKKQMVSTHDFDATSFSEDGDGPNKERSKYTPDLYIPAMAFMTYVLLTCISLGLDNRFGPTMIFKNAANCSLLTIFEALLIKTCVYIAISKNPPFLDTLSLASYKYYGLCFIIITNFCITSEAGGAYLDWTVKIYYCVTSAFGMYQMVKRIGEREPTPANSPVDPTKAEDKLRAFALGLAAGQIFLSWILIKLSQ